MNHGFGNYFSSEAIKGALPQSQNSPLHPAFNLYPEQINGSAFTRARHQNLHTWVYRLLPSANHHKHAFEICDTQWQQPLEHMLAPHPLRWSAHTNTSKNKFIHSMEHIASSANKHVYLFSLSQSMHDEYFVDLDGELLFLAYEGSMRIHTELGILEAKPKQLLVIPRGIAFKIEIKQACKAYVLENQGLALKLPELGPLGANALAHPRHFIYPDASFETHSQPGKLYAKYKDKLWVKTIEASVLDVVAWHGNYAPYQYDLDLFNTMNTVSYDHPDPSIFTVLSSESAHPGIASLDFVIFPKRWMVANHSMRLPYFHRNVMSELMGLIEGEYDAKDHGFERGGISIHNAMLAHGPDHSSYQTELSRKEGPSYLNNGLAFMFESNDLWIPTEAYMRNPCLDVHYRHCWQGFPSAKS